MTSSQKPYKGVSRRFFWLGTAIVVAIALYSAGWLYAADRLISETRAATDRLSRDGNRAQCEDADARGYPFRIGLHCMSVFLERRDQGFAVNAGAFRSAAQFYAPMQVVAELDGPARLDIPHLAPLHLNWKVLRSSARLARPLPKRLSMEATALTVNADTTGGGNEGLFDADKAELHLRPHGANLDLAVRLDGFDAGPLLTDSAFPKIAGLVDLNVIDGTKRITGRNFDLHGMSFEIRRIDLKIDGGGSVVATGPFSISEDGLINADLGVKASDAAALLAIVANAFPEIGSQILALSAGLTALGPDQPLPLKIHDGVVMLGFIQLGSIPPL